MNPQILRKLRKELKLSQNDLAEKIGVSTSAIGMYEQGRREPDHDTLLKLAQCFAVSVDYLMGRTTEKPVNQEHFANELFQNLMEQHALMFRTQGLSDEDFKQLEKAVRQAVDITVERKAKQKP